MMKVVITVLRLTYYLISLILSTSLNFVLNIQNINTKIVIFNFNQTKIQKNICYNHVKTLAFYEVNLRGAQSLAFTL